MELSLFTSQKFKFYSFLSMFLLVYVHGYNLNETYLQPSSLVAEPLNVTTFTEYFLSNGIFRFRIPMLFIISGFLYALHDAKPYALRMKKRLRTLLIPYLLWSAVGLAITFLWQQFPVTAQAVRDAGIDQMGDNRPYSQIGWQGILSRWLLAPISFQLWFIRVLLVYNAIYPVLKWLVTKYAVAWFIIAGLLWISSSGFYLVEGEGLFFFTLGIWICKRNNYLVLPPAWMNIRLMWMLFIGLAIAKSLLAFYLPPTVVTFITLSLLHKTVVFTGLVSVWYGADTLVRFCMSKKGFVWVSSFSFIIYALHVPLVNYCTRLIFRYYHNLLGYRLITYCFLPLMIVLGCIFTGWLMRKLRPGVYAVATGGRGMN